MRAMANERLKSGHVMLATVLVVLSAAYMGWVVRGKHQAESSLTLFWLCLLVTLIGCGMVTGWCCFRYVGKGIPRDSVTLMAGLLSFGAYALVSWISMGYGDYSEGHSTALKTSAFLVVTGWIPFVVGLIFGSGLGQKEK